MYWLYLLMSVCIPVKCGLEGDCRNVLSKASTFRLLLSFCFIYTLAYYQLYIRFLTRRILLFCFEVYFCMIYWIDGVFAHVHDT